MWDGKGTDNTYSLIIIGQPFDCCSSGNSFTFLPSTAVLKVEGRLAFVAEVSISMLVVTAAGTKSSYVRAIAIAGSEGHVRKPTGLRRQLI